MEEMSAKSDMEKAEKEIERLREFEITPEQADRELQEESARLDELENVKKSLSEARAREARLDAAFLHDWDCRCGNEGGVDGSCARCNFDGENHGSSEEWLVEHDAVIWERADNLMRDAWVRSSKERLENVKKSLSESRAREARLRKAAQRMIDEWNVVASTVSESGRGTPCGATKDFLDALSSTEPAEKFLNEERAKVWEEAAKCMDNQPGPVGPVSMAIWFRDRATACRNNLESKSGSVKGE